MKLFATPLSHFSRKVRLLLDHYEVPFELVNVGNVGSADPDQFPNTPLMAVPVLQDGDLSIIESDHIAAYLVQRLDPVDRYGVLTREPMALNARAVLNGIMTSEVRVILAERAGLDPGETAYFRKFFDVISQGLAWLEARSDLFGGATPSYLDFHLVSAWDHLKHYAVQDLPYASLKTIVESLSASETVAKSAPRAAAP